METREAPPAHTAAAGGLPEHHREQRHFPQEPSGAPASLHCAAFVRAPPPPILPRCGANILGKPHSGCVPRHEPCVKLDLEHLHGRHLREEAQEQPSSGWVGAPPGSSRVPGTESPRQGSRRRDTQTSG